MSTDHPTRRLRRALVAIADAIGFTIGAAVAALCSAIAAGHFAIFPAAVLYPIVGSWQPAWIGSTVVLWVALCTWIAVGAWRERGQA